MSTVQAGNGEISSGFRLDVPLHNLLTQPGLRTTVPPASKPEKLSNLVFPQYLEVLGDDGLTPPMPPPKRPCKVEHITRAMRGWTVPWLKARVLPGDFHPIIAYLFTEWKCNLDSHYCWAFDNRVKEMTEEIAKRSIDRLRDTGAGVLALMGGEPTAASAVRAQGLLSRRQEGLLDLRPDQCPPAPPSSDRLARGRWSRDLQLRCRRRRRKAWTAESAGPYSLLLQLPGEEAVPIRVQPSSTST